MIFDLIWTGGEAACAFVLIYGAYLALIETGLSLRIRDQNSRAQLALSLTELAIVKRLVPNGLAGHLASGNDLIDQQHHQASRDIEDLRTAIVSGKIVGEVCARIDALMRGMVRHFDEEEALLATTDYPETARHTAAHRELVEGAERLVVRFYAHTAGITELFEFLVRDVLTVHTLKADKDFLPYLQRRYHATPLAPK